MEWKKDFDKKFTVRHDCSGSFEHEEFCQGCIEIIIEEIDDIKDFIEKVLSQQRQELKKKVEGIKKNYKAFMADTKSQARSNLKSRGYNEALSDIITILEEGEK
jgi:ElaB/YqjD/DUF883 family membrane-anchored ribosome-binding protein